ncbi:MAG: hypothetical protein WAW10_06985 [Gallionella sp.]
MTLVASLLIRPGFAESLKTSGWKYQEESGWKTPLTEFGRRLKGAVEFVVSSANPTSPQFLRMIALSPTLLPQVGEGTAELYG